MVRSRHRVGARRRPMINSTRVSNHDGSSFETPRYAWLLRMRVF
jgi:hypothetical protein